MKYLVYTAIAFLFQTNIYSIHFYDTGGADQSFSSFEGKKILVVNIATGSNQVNQLSELQQLQEQHADSLVVIAFPSNSFGNEPRTDDEIKSVCENTYHTSFLIGKKGAVNGPNALTIYQWLTTLSENGSLNIQVGNDFQKYLIDKNGSLIGVFAGSVSPLNYQIQTAISAN